MQSNFVTSFSHAVNVGRDAGASDLRHDDGGYPEDESTVARLVRYHGTVFQ